MSRMERADLSMTASDNSRDGSRSSSPEPQPPATPSFSEMRRSLSSKSLRDLELRRLPKRVWRKPTEERRLPRDLEQLAIWSARGALRAFISGYGCRAGVNLVLILFRVLRNAKVKSADLQRALAGEDNFRFGGAVALARTSLARRHARIVRPAVALHPQRAAHLERRAEGRGQAGVLARGRGRRRRGCVIAATDPI